MRQHPAVIAWRELDPDGPAPVSIDRVYAKNKATVVYRLSRGHAGGGAVIAKRCSVERTEAERIIYQDVLRLVAVPTPQFYGAVRQSNGGYGWLFVEEAVGSEYDGEDGQHRAAAARWLARFHAAASHLGVRDRLPGREPQYYLQQLQSARAAIAPRLGTRHLTDDDDATLRALLQQCDRFEGRWREIETFFEGVPRTVVHDDFSVTNLCVQRRANDDIDLLAFDWEDAGWGVPAADLAHFPVEASMYAVRPDLGIYRSVVADAWPHLDEHDVHLIAEFGTVFRAVSELWWESWRISYPYQSDRERAWLTEFITAARLYLTRMDETAAAAGWAS